MRLSRALQLRKLALRVPAQWFGPELNLAICQESPKCDTPSEPCVHCAEHFRETESGIRDYNHMPMHIECFVRLFAGSAAHQLQMCTCYGGTWEDPPELSVHEAARLAFDIASRRV